MREKKKLWGWYIVELQTDNVYMKILCCRNYIIAKSYLDFLNKGQTNG